MSVKQNRRVKQRSSQEAEPPEYVVLVNSPDRRDVVAERLAEALTSRRHTT
jgi:hypothetical protein